MNQYGETIYGTRGGDVVPHTWGIQLDQTKPHQAWQNTNKIREAHLWRNIFNHGAI